MTSKITAFLVSILLLAGCVNPEYVKSTDGDDDLSSSGS